MGLTVEKNEDGTVTIACEDQEVRVSGGSQGSNQDDDQNGASPPIVLDPPTGGGAFLKAKKRPRILISVMVESVQEIKEFANNLRHRNFLRLKDSDTVLVRFTWVNKEKLDLSCVLKEFEDDIQPDLNGYFHYQILMSHDE